MPSPWAGDTRVRLIGCSLIVRMPDFEQDVWIRRYEELRGRAKNLQPVFEKFGPYFLESVDRNFAAQGRPTPWPPLSPQYAARKAQKYPGATILVCTGAMRNAFWWLASAQTFKAGNRQPYFIYHQSEKPRKVLPRRVMMLLQRADKAYFTRLVRQYIRTGEV